MPDRPLVQESTVYRTVQQRKADMAASNVELIHTLDALTVSTRQAQHDLSNAFEATDSDDADSLWLDEAMKVLNDAHAAIRTARLKVAAYEGLRQAYTQA